jgi:hypothetical protein
MGFAPLSWLFILVKEFNQLLFYYAPARGKNKDFLENIYKSDLILAFCR